MKRIAVYVMAFMLVAMVGSEVQAQRFGAPESMKGKFVTGGNIGAGYSGRTLYFSIAPQLGYRLTKDLEMGVRLGYNLNFYNDYYGYYGNYGNYFYHYFNASVYANYEIFSGLYLHVEDEEVCCLVRGENINPTPATWYNSILVGGGYRQYFSPTGFVYYALLYDLSWDYINLNSPYVSPFIVRVGYCVGFGGKRR